MKAISPNTGAPEEIFAKNQDEYVEVPIAIYPEYEGPGTRGLLWRFTFTEEERERIYKHGEDVYIMQLNFNKPMTPMAFCVGPHPSWVLE